MRVTKYGRYFLNAPWHQQHGKEVEVIMRRKGESPSFKDKTIYHIATDPDEEYRFENFDEEFLKENFKELESLICVVDTSSCSEETIDKFKTMFKKIKIKLKNMINCEFVDKKDHVGEFVCEFKLSEKDGEPVLIFDEEEFPLD